MVVCRPVIHSPSTVSFNGEWDPPVQRRFLFAAHVFLCLAFGAEDGAFPSADGRLSGHGGSGTENMTTTARLGLEPLPMEIEALQSKDKGKLER